MGIQKGLDDLTRMRFGMVLQQHEPPAVVTQDLRQEAPDLRPPHRALTKADRQAQAPLVSRDDQRANRIDLARLEGDRTVRRVAAWRPCALDVGHQPEATFVQENQRNAQLLALFLAAASGTAASAQSGPRRVAWRAAQVSGNSSPGAARATTRRWDDSAGETSVGSRWQCGLMSTVRWGSQRLPLPPTGWLPVRGVRPRTTWRGVPRRREHTVLSPHPVRNRLSSGTPSPAPRTRHGRRGPETSRASGVGWHVAVAVRAIALSHEVACRLAYAMSQGECLITYSKLNSFWMKPLSTVPAQGLGCL